MKEFVALIGIGQLPPTARAHQFPVSTLAPNPQLQRFCLLLDFVSVDPIPRPPQYFGPIRLSHPAECIESSPKSKCPLNVGELQIPAQSLNTKPPGHLWSGSCRQKT